MDATVIILGATGDLTKRKLIPALHGLLQHKRIGKLVLIGAARKKKKISSILKAGRKHVKNEHGSSWKKLVAGSYYQQLDFYTEESYQDLKHQVETLEKKHKISGPRIFYLATLPNHFDIITKNLASHTLVTASSKVIYEKPFGHNLKSAKKINTCLRRAFKEKQIYRIDHYLGKELVSDLALLRFSNRILAPLWGRAHVESVHITLRERLLVGTRGGFYDKYGVLKDVVQNHALQLLSLVAMKEPKSLTALHIRNEKAKILRKTKALNSVLGQYKGYHRELGVKSSSKTPTYAKVELRVRSRNWSGVPFFIEAGKGLDRKETSIVLQFKKVPCKMARGCPTIPNQLRINIEPHDGFSLTINSKMPGKKISLVPVEMTFCQEQRFGPNTVRAYETLLEDVLNDDQSAFVRNDEIENAWRIIDSMKSKSSLKKYKIGSGVLT